ncbi:Armadillo-type fold [Pseudocohnilembus persalinus]|uniref:Armadillo-type fold n=1 Tax=Pseudocohnilembus persalinus TaxID=266149 RepID=A0A0V0QKD7_PSEPJ|nr:Armadillo-type fold [Pseudocohnilembus persalinus]|eukprot:KRX02646.1 Armadillo-type fold [Pseudocohnilembus persalinus]
MQKLHFPQPSKGNMKQNVTSSCPPDEKQFQQAQQQSQFKQSQQQTKKQFNFNAQEFDFAALSQNNNNSQNSLNTNNQGNNKLNGNNEQKSVQQKTQQENLNQFNLDINSKEQQNLPKLKPRKKMQLNSVKFEIKSEPQQPIQTNKQSENKDALTRLNPENITQQKQKEDDEKKKQEEKKQLQKLIEDRQKKIDHQKARFFSGEQFTLDPKNVDYKYVKIYYELNEKDLSRPENGNLPEDLEQYNEIEIISGYWERKSEKRENKIVIKKGGKNDKYNSGYNKNYKGSQKNKPYENKSNYQNQNYGNTNNQGSQNFNVKGQQYEVNQQKQASQNLELNKKQPSVGGFQRKQVNVEEQKIKDSIKNTTGKWMENALKQNEDDIKKAEKNMMFLLQTLSPDNIDKRLVELYEYNSDDLLRQKLIKFIIEKGHKQWKYVKTFAELCQKIISRIQKDTGSSKSAFKSELISQIQNLLSKEEDIPESVLEQTQEQQEKYFDKIRQTKKLFVVFIGECIKVKVLPQKVNNHVIAHFLNQFFHYYQLLKRQEKNKPTQITAEQLKVKYHSNIMIETLVKFLDTNGESIDIKKDATQNQELFKILFQVLKNPTEGKIIPKEDSNKEQMDLYNIKYDEFLKLSLDEIFNLLNILDKENLLEPRLLFLIQNLQERRNEGWKESISTRGNTAMKLDDVKSQYTIEPQEKKQQRDNKQRAVNYKAKEPVKQEQQQQQQKSGNLEITSDDIQLFEKQNKKVIEDFYSVALSNGENGADMLINEVKKQNFANYQIIPYLFFYSCKIKNDIEKNIILMKNFLKKYFAQQDNKQNMGNVLEGIILSGYLNRSDYNSIPEVFAVLLTYLRSELKLISVDQIIVRTQDDEDEDEEVLDYVKQQLELFGKKTQEFEPDLSKFKPELEKLTSKVEKELKCEVEKLYDEIIKLLS